jgi:serine/threonine protein kinase
MALPIGSRLGAFEVVSSLGAGGMGDVYRARDTRLERMVAIEVLPSVAIPYWGEEMAARLRQAHQ